MDAVTYPNEDVQRLLAEGFACFKPAIEGNEDLARRFGVKWTPGLLWLDEEGRVHHSNVGFFQPDELRAEATFAGGKVAGGKGDWKTAGARYDEVVEHWPRSFAVPAALYWGGVASKMESGGTDGLMERWRRLLDQHPESAWAMKVSFLAD